MLSGSAAVLAVAVLLKAASGAGLQAEVTLRARVTSLAPSEPVRIYYRFGGEGFGGPVLHGELTQLPSEPRALAQLGKPGIDYFPTSDKPGASAWMQPGRWSKEIPLSALDSHGHGAVVTFTAEGMKSGVKSASLLKNVVFEFEVRHGGRVLKDIVERGPDGPTATLRIPLARLGTGSTPSREFVEDTNGISEHAKRRLRYLESLPWAHEPVPKRLALLTDCDGYRPGAGFTIRTTDKDVMLMELRSARQLGVNGLRSTPDFVVDMLRKKEGIGAEFSRVRIGRGVGYPVPIWDFHKNPASGCPYHPSLKDLRERQRAQAALVFSDPARRAGAEELWLNEGDEIGTVFDFAAESKAHQSVCPYCRKAFHDYVRSFGAKLSDFGAKSWDDVRSTYGYWAKSYAERQAEAAAAAASAKAAPAQMKPASGSAPSSPPAPPLPEPGRPNGPPPIVQDGQRAPLSERGWALLHYYSRRFNQDSSTMLLTPVRDYFLEQNELKRRALAEGRLDSPEAKQPWVYTYALRGVNWMIAGHSLEYFEYYRHADTGFMYETSNRDPRAWEWDSYMCDVGRILSDKMGKRFAVSVKPNRGAVIQRALTAVSREAKLLFWYDFGPDWWKGDTFAESQAHLAKTSRVARLLAGAEDVIYDAKWAVPAEVAVVRPLTSEIFESNASWENGKWVYRALQHRHIPVDPLDEGMLESEDLSRYKIIYVSGSHLRRSAAVKLAAWVQRGGIVYTSGWGLSRNEANEPLAELAPALGLRARGSVELWNDVWRYAATRLTPLRNVKETPAYASITGKDPFSGSYPIAIGREVLDPSPGTEVLATFGDGKAAITRHTYGKGAAYVAGYYPGVEYSVELTQADYDMTKDLNPVKATYVAAPALAAGVHPVVDASSPLVEGILLKNTQTGKMAVSLMNWAYKTHPLDPHEDPPMNWDHIPLDSVTIQVAHVGTVQRVRSTWAKHLVPFAQKGDSITVTVPKLEEADVLLLE